MKRALLISLSLVVALGGWSAVGAEDGIYVIPSMKVVPKTGQTETYGTRDDGALQKGVTCSTPRFTDNGNGTVTDNLTRLIWMKNANALGPTNWVNALTTANTLASGMADLSDGSQAGDWRLPNVRELQSLVDYGRFNPALPADHPFTIVPSSYFWSSTTCAGQTIYYSYQVWYTWFVTGGVSATNKDDLGEYVWCVRGGP
jgi:hypothetical protein